jgi:NADH-quinone oxidoreductase subunit M
MCTFTVRFYTFGQSFFETIIMVLLLLILIPLLTGILAFSIKGQGARTFALMSTVVTMAVSGFVCATVFPNNNISFVQPWIPVLGAQMSFMADGMSAMLCLLTGIVMMVVMLFQSNKETEKPNSFYGLMLLSQAGLMGVFLASDALLFYFFWELALIPVYFLCSIWGGEKRIQVTFKFFVYTFLGSLMMLAGIIYLAQHTTAGGSYAWADIVQAGASLPPMQQQWIFVLIFLAFAIKMPIFPFHTWQPDAYEQSPTPVTIVLSALMVKMGMYAVLRWLLPVVPAGVAFWSDTVIILSVIGIVYASLLAMVQTDMKRLVAYSSIAHMGLMCAAAFAGSSVGTQGVAVQMFNHGINITGLWLIVNMVENRWGTRDMTKLGGMAVTAPVMAIALAIISFASIALPLTNGFVGEFMMFNGLFGNTDARHITMVVAGLGVILGAVYTLNMIQKTTFGEATTMVIAKDVSLNEILGIVVIIAIIIILGVYPKPLLDLTAAIK